MKYARVVAGIFVAAAATAALGFGSRVPYTPEGAEAALLRLSWRLRGEKVETCRDRTQAELDALPVHMRTPQICTGHLVAYRMTLRIDGVVVDTATYLPAGAKGDRPIFVLHDEPMTVGEHDVEVDFVPTEHVPGTTARALRYRGRVQARTGRIQMITLSPDASRLLLLE